MPLLASHGKHPPAPATGTFHQHAGEISRVPVPAKGGLRPSVEPAWYISCSFFLRSTLRGAPSTSLKEAHMIALKDVLVATDFEEAAAVALTYGRSLARTFGARLHVVHVLDDIGSRAATMAGYGVDIGRMQVELEGAAQSRLDSLLWDEDRRDLGATSVVLTSTTPASAIVQYATDAKVNLIVVGTHGRGAVSHFLVGSVAERIVRTAPCPVLTVRSRERDFVVPDALQKVPDAATPAAGS